MVKFAIGLMSFALNLPTGKWSFWGEFISQKNCNQTCWSKKFGQVKMTLLPWLAGNNGTHGKVCLNTGCQLTKGFDCKWHSACSLPSQRMHNNCSWLCHFWWNQDLLIAAIVASHCNDFFVWVCPVNVLCRPVIWYTLWLRQTCQQLPKNNLC